MGVCDCSMYGCTLLCVHSSIAIILMGKRELVALLNLSSWGRLDLAVLFTPSTPNRQNRNQVRWNTCADVRRSTPSSKVVQTEQSRDLFQNKMAEHCLHCTEIIFSLSR